MTVRRISWFMVLFVGIVLLVILVLLRKTNQDIPEIYVSNETIDLGTINGLLLHQDPNRSERVRFKIKNCGTGVLKLEQIYASCLCLDPRLDKTVLLPDEVAELSVRVTVPIRTGQFREKILLSSNDEKNPTKKLIVKGFVHRPSYVLPESVAINGLCFGKNRQIELEITGPEGDDSFTVGKISTNSNNIKTCEIVNIGIIQVSWIPV